MPASPQILLVDDNRQALDTWTQLLRNQGHGIVEAIDPEHALVRLQSGGVGLVFSDMRMNRDDDGLELLRAVRTLHPAIPFVLYTGWHINPVDAQLASDIGADAILTLPVGNELIVATVQHYLNRSCDERQRITRAWTDRLICASEAMQSLCTRIDHIQSRERPALITGETGTGKELVARYIHAAGGAERPFVAVNCGCISPALVESTLFGHRKGAFTSADVAGAGLVEAAQGGTLFLDEIGELPLEIQATLLRFLDTREYRRVGEVQTRHLDAQILAATNRQLFEEVRAGRFRKDLYYRLNAATYHLPPLRARHDDLLNFLARWRFRAGWQSGRRVSVTADGVARLTAHDWPGNFRELHHVLDRANDLSRTGEIGLPEIQFAIGSPNDAETPTDRSEIKSCRISEDAQRAQVLMALERNHWKIDKTAKSLAMNRWKLRRLLRALRIDS